MCEIEVVLRLNGDAGDASKAKIMSAIAELLAQICVKMHKHVARLFG